MNCLRSYQRILCSFKWLLLVGFLLACNACAAQIPEAPIEWGHFRGPGFNPIAEEPNLPNRWSTDENVEWSRDVPGRGWSSPIVFAGKVFVTSVVTDGKSKAPQTGTDYSNAYVAELSQQGLSEEEIISKVNERDFELPDEVYVHYWLHCFQLDSGKEVWKQEFYDGRPPGGRHRKNSFASETPTTDGERVYVYVTNLGLFAYDLEGKFAWKTDLPKNKIYLDFGTGSSPIVIKDQIVVLADNEEHSTISAYDCASGNLRWKTDRQPSVDHAEGLPKSGWTTPLLWNNPVRPEIVTLGPGLAVSYDLEGHELWRMSGMTPAPAASSLVYGDQLILNAGKSRPVYAIRPGAVGDITVKKKDELGDYIAWMQPRLGTYIPTPVAYDGGLYILSDKGIVTRLDIATGEINFKKRLTDPDAEGTDFTASVWAYNGHVFCASEQGNIYVLKAGPEFELSHINRLGDWIMASPAIVGDRLLLRTERTLYSFRQPRVSSVQPL